MKSREQFGIGELADHFGLATHVLRHWESVGLLNPARKSGRRRYGRVEAYRVAAILRAKEAGLGLDAIRTLLDAEHAAERTEILRAQRTELRERIAQAQASLRLVEHALDCDYEDLARCPNVQAQLAERVRGLTATSLRRL